MRKLAPYLVSVFAVTVLLSGCDWFRTEKQVEFWFGDVELEAQEKVSKSLMSISYSPVKAYWMKELDEEVPSYIKGLRIDSICGELTNLDSINAADFNLYVSEDSLDWQTLDTSPQASKISVVNLEPGEQITVNGGNYKDYFFNLDSLVDELKDGHVWAYAVGESSGSYLHILVYNYTIYITVTVGLF
ncbi:MAG TPA: hypothetical protein EYP60_03655 [bacterium (Candidatus Stahlbacteria)]|nr:hypothetical protein [Candidatus Stahlbacteria bacterium]